jgi:hypothetical protein
MSNDPTGTRQLNEVRKSTQGLEKKVSDMDGKFSKGIEILKNKIKTKKPKPRCVGSEKFSKTNQKHNGKQT